MSNDSPRARWLRSAVVALAAIGALAVALHWAQRPPEGPVEPDWSRTSCAHCGMMVGEPAFAAQLHTPAGDVRFFDDPGCLLLYAAEHPGDEASAWFHHLRDARWIPANLARFAPASPTPMGYGLGAVDGSEPGAIPRAEALEAAQHHGATGLGASP